MTTRHARSSLYRDDRGSATAETAIILPVLLVMVVLLAIVGAGLSSHVRAEGAARSAARELARGEDESAAAAAARLTACPDARVEVTRSDPWVRVRVTCTIHPLGAGPLAGAAFTAEGQATARLEPQLLQGSP